LKKIRDKITEKYFIEKGNLNDMVQDPDWKEIKEKDKTFFQK
jgi:hypothetical protein